EERGGVVEGRVGGREWCFARRGGGGVWSAGGKGGGSVVGAPRPRGAGGWLPRPTTATKSTLSPPSLALGLCVHAPHHSIEDGKNVKGRAGEIGPTVSPAATSGGMPPCVTGVAALGAAPMAHRLSLGRQDGPMSMSTNVDQRQTLIHGLSC